MVTNEREIAWNFYLMATKDTLFYNEEQVLQKTVDVIKLFKDQDTEFCTVYEQLSKNYKKLLKHTKLLVKMGDRQQNHLTNLAAKIEAKNQELVNLNQEKNEFLGIVAHDLRNPLNGIQGGAGYILEEFENLSKKEVIEMAKMIEQASYQMLYLVNNLLDVNAIESGKINLSLKIIDLLPTVQALFTHYEKNANAKNLSLQFYSQKQKYLIFVDKNMINQVLDNLISNAIKYSPLGSKIYIRLSHNCQQVRCEVQDEGPGLSESDQKNLFGKFVRLTPEPTAHEHSTGLGLFIVKKLVTAMNGKVWCESYLGKGTTFVITFPIIT